MTTLRPLRCPWCREPTEAEDALCQPCWDRLSEEGRIARLPAFLAGDGADHYYLDRREMP